MMYITYFIERTRSSVQSMATRIWIRRLMELEYKDPGNYESPEEKAIMFRILRSAYKPLGLPCFYRRVRKYHVKFN